MTSPRERLGARLRTARGDRSPLEVALALGVNQSTVYRWEAGAVDLTVVRLQEIADFYDVPLASLLDDTAEAVA